MINWDESPGFLRLIRLKIESTAIPKIWKLKLNKCVLVQHSCWNWSCISAVNSTSADPPGSHNNFPALTLTAHLALIHKIVKHFITANSSQVNALVSSETGNNSGRPRWHNKYVPQGQMELPFHQWLSEKITNILLKWAMVMQLFLFF